MLFCAPVYVTGASNGCGRTRVGRSQVGLIRANLNRFNRHVYSLHTGGSQVALVDGSVRFLSENLDRTVLRSLLTRGVAKLWVSSDQLRTVIQLIVKGSNSIIACVAYTSNCRLSCQQPSGDGSTNRDCRAFLIPDRDTLQSLLVQVARLNRE